ncbi:MAG: RidA family protein [Candidatus Nanopelagicales bacterium]
MPSLRARLAELGLTLPPAPPALANYSPAVRCGGLVFTAGQLPLVAGTLPLTGRVGAEVSLDQAAELARQCALNLLAAAATVVDLDEIAAVVKVVGFVACPADFLDHPRVLNGASDLFADLFGEPGRHARSAVGVASLPLGAPVELEAIFAITASEAPVEPASSVQPVQTAKSAD